MMITQKMIAQKNDLDDSVSNFQHNQRTVKRVIQKAYEMQLTFSSSEQHYPMVKPS